LEQRLQLDEEENRAIEIVGLRKEFGSGEDKVVAVSDLSISIFQNQIFALLGHNGAGKTTTISMITGMTEPTSGYLGVLGETEIEQIRNKLGVCPQHDTLYEDLTVEQHLELFSGIKGLEGRELQTEVDKLIADVNLHEKRFEFSKNLSGGQKRRLSVALAFVGKSKIIILDEPTSGMDTSARRFIWDLLKNYKNDRVIILTTHLMDEADYLGDRIGIMGDGSLLCCGSSVFLKNHFGHGYSLNFSKQSAKIGSKPMLNIIKKYVPKYKVLTDIGTSLTIQLPLSNMHNFPNLFAEIDSKKEALQYVEYGISISTLEEVFLNISDQLESQR
jgi:ATP-binding cassette, subfamily A (ABC1), member 3